MNTAEKIKPEQSSRGEKQTKRIKIAQLAVKGITEREIATLTNTPKTTVHQQIQKLKTDPNYMVFADNKAETLEQLQYKILNAVDHEAIKSMVNKRGVTDIAILQDKIQLLRGQLNTHSLTDIRVLIDMRPQVGGTVIDVTPGSENGG